MKNQIFIQARVNSTRYPRKILKKIDEKTILEIILDRIRNIKNINKIILVTGIKEKNNELVDEARKLGLDVFCGDEENILDRFYHAAKKFQPDNIIRITGDCPLIDSRIINQGLEIFNSKQIDLLTNTKKRTFAHGLDFEIFSKRSLDKAWNDVIGNDKEKRGEFVNPIEYIINSNKFNIHSFENDKDDSKIRITIDYPEDFTVISKIYNELNNKKSNFSSSDIIDFLYLHPELVNLNDKYEKN